MAWSSWIWYVETDLNFSICLDLHTFNSNWIIDTDIHISQLHITLWCLLVFAPEEVHIFFSENLQLLRHLNMILNHKNYHLVGVLLSCCVILWWVFEWVFFRFCDFKFSIIFNINMVVFQRLFNYLCMITNPNP